MVLLFSVGQILRQKWAIMNLQRVCIAQLYTVGQILRQKLPTLNLLRVCILLLFSERYESILYVKFLVTRMCLKICPRVKRIGSIK